MAVLTWETEPGHSGLFEPLENIVCLSREQHHMFLFAKAREGIHGPPGSRKFSLRCLRDPETDGISMEGTEEVPAF